MRNLSEIIETAKDGEMPSHEECYWAMLALDALGFFDHRALSDLANRPNKIFGPDHYWKESFNRRKRAYLKDPQTYVGPNNDPSNPDYQKMRTVALKIYDKALKGELGS